MGCPCFFAKQPVNLADEIGEFFGVLLLGNEYGKLHTSFTVCLHTFHVTTPGASVAALLRPGPFLAYALTVRASTKCLQNEVSKL